MHISIMSIDLLPLGNVKQVCDLGGGNGRTGVTATVVGWSMATRQHVPFFLGQHHADDDLEKLLL